MKEIKLNVEGMVCGGCEKRVVNALSTIEGVIEVKADYTSGTVLVKAEDNVSEEILKEKINDISFNIKGE